MKKKTIALLLAVAMTAALLFGCAPAEEGAETPAPTPDAAEEQQGEEPAGGAADGTYTATAQGFGGEVSVTITVEGGALSAVEAVGGGETAGIGSRAIEELPEAILEAGSAEVDGVSGATFTSDAVKSAARAAMTEAGLVQATSAEVQMAPGTYRGQAFGYAMNYPISVDVTVDEDSIIDIVVDHSTLAENGHLFKMVENTLIPRMLKDQSVGIDSVTGATASSTGVKLAVADALEQAFAAAGADTSAVEMFKKTVEKPGGSEELTAQVLVVGMGGSGMATALSSSEYGLDVLAIDKMATYGGTTALTGTVMAVNPEGHQALYNNGEDWTDAAALKEDWMAITFGDAKEEMIDLFIENSGDMLDWLMENYGVEFVHTPAAGMNGEPFRVGFDFYNVSVDYSAFATEYFDGMWQTFLDRGNRYLLETEAYELLTDDSGAVVGVKARNLADGTEYTIYADAVVLATGGFAGNAEMEEEYFSNEYYNLKGAWCHKGLYGNDGKMIQAAIDLGAGTYNIGMPPMVHNCGTPLVLRGYDVTIQEGQFNWATRQDNAWSIGDLPLMMAISPTALAVDTEGERFTDENNVSFLKSWIAGPRFYSLWTAEQIDEVRDEGFKFTPLGPSTLYLGYQGGIPANTPIPEAYDVLEDAISQGIAYKADTLEELAGLIGVDAAALQATVEEYNAACAAGVDEEFGKSADYLDALDEGPYYAVVAAPYCYTTCGGLDVDTKMQVLKADHETPIEGLYAVGTDSMGVLLTEKDEYVSYGGAANGWGLTSGYLCGIALGEMLGNE